MWATIILGVIASGRKLLPVFIWKGKRGGNLEREGDVYVAFQEKAW